MGTGELSIIQFAREEDIASIMPFLEKAEWKHQHLDWLSPKDLLRKDSFLLMLSRRELIGCLACPSSSGACAWIRIFAAAKGNQPQRIWDELWPVAFEQLQSNHVRTIAALILAHWLRPLLLRDGFGESNALVFLRWDGEPPDSVSCPGQLRGALPGDHNALIQLDQMAFHGLWMNTDQELEQAFRQASVMTVVEYQDQLIGYQISTLSAWGFHLARLAVDPDWQGMGIGSALIADLLQKAASCGYPSVTVNTQEDNPRSIRLYRRLGFRPSGDRYAILERHF